MAGCIIKEEQTQVQIAQNLRLLFNVSVIKSNIRCVSLWFCVYYQTIQLINQNHISIFPLDQVRHIESLILITIEILEFCKAGKGFISSGF